MCVCAITVLIRKVEFAWATTTQCYSEHCRCVFQLMAYTDVPCTFKTAWQAERHSIRGTIMNSNDYRKEPEGLHCESNLLYYPQTSHYTHAHNHQFYDIMKLQLWWSEYTHHYILNSYA